MAQVAVKKKQTGSRRGVCVCVVGGVILKTRADVQKHGVCGVGNKCSARF